MISLVVGRPGAGKTLWAVENILLTPVSKQKIVVTNFILYPYYISFSLLTKKFIFTNIHKFDYIYYWDEDIQSLVKFLMEYNLENPNLREGSIDIYIDESIFFINKRFAQKKEIIEFLTKHRKYKCNLFFLVQSKRSLLPEFREFVERQIIIRKLADVFFFLPIPNVRIVYHKSNFDNEFFLINLWTIKPFLFRFYNSYQLNVDKEVKGVIKMKEIVLKNPSFSFLLSEKERDDGKETRQGGSLPSFSSSWKEGT